MTTKFRASRRSSSVLRIAFAIALALSAGIDADAQVAHAGRNVNMASGTTLPDGDPFLQRQNEVSVACSSRDPRTCVAMANDYRTVDVPGLSGGRVIGDAWMGAFFTVDGGETWTTKLVPGYPQDPSNASPLKGFEAAADPTVRTGTNGMFYAAGIAFNRSAVPGNVPLADRSKPPSQPPNRFARTARAVLRLFVDDEVIASWFGSAGAAPPPPPASKTGVVFIARYIDDNNVDNGTADKVAYLGTIVVDAGKPIEFLDKPSLAVDVPRAGAGTCTIPAHGSTPVQSFAGGTLHVAYTAASSNLKKTDLMYTRSTNCGVTWDKPQSIDQKTKINQGAAIAIDPRTGAVNVFWRVFEGKQATDGIYMARSIDGGQKFSKPSLALQFPAAHRPFDQSTLPDDTVTTYRAFRSNALPTAVTDQFSRTYLAVSQRGWAPVPANVPAADRDARIVIASTVCVGATCTPFTAPAPIDNHPARGHQFMPALTLTAGKLAIGWQDSRDSFGPKLTTGGEGFGPVIADPVTFTPYHTLDVRLALATPGAAPVFTDYTLDNDGKPIRPSTRVSRYLHGFNPQQPNDVRQVEFNASNYPLVVDGTRPFIGDYIDVSPTVPFLLSANGTWTHNLGIYTLPEPSPLLPQVMTTWGDNRDVRPPADGDWTHYTPPNSLSSSVQCVPGQEGMRNQNPYASKVTEGIVLTAPGIAKPVNAIQRAFSVALENATDQRRTFTLQIMTQPPSPGKASFLQFPTSGFDDPMQTLSLNIPARSTASRSVFVTSPPGQPFVPITVRAQEEGGTLQSAIVLNSDAATNPLPADTGLLTAESYDPIISRTVVRTLNPDFLNPDFLNPDFLNPDFLNPDFLNPDFLNPDFLNPDFLNPDFLNPDFLNPDFLNPDFLNATAAGDQVTSVEWTVTNVGNTTASYAFRPVLQITPEEADKFAFLLFVSRLYQTPVVENCQIVLRTHEQTLAIIPNPDFLNPDFLNPDFLNPDFLNPDFLNPDFLNPDFLNSPISESAGNTTLTIAPKTTLKVTLLVRHDGSFNGEEATATSAAVLPQAVDTETATTACADNNPATRCGPEPATIVPLTIVFKPLSTGFTSFAYTDSVTAVGGTGPYAWSASGLPAGLAINPATGAITGTPSATGTFPIVVTVTDSTAPLALADDQQYTLSIANPLAPIVVTNSASTGPGSLRAAIDWTNTTPANLILFNIPGGGVHKILPQTPLPAITQPVVIDGTSQPGYAGTPLIEIDGSSAGLSASGLTITAGSSSVKGLIINRFAVDGLVLQSAGNNLITSNYIGTNAAGTAAAGNGGNAITIIDSGNNVIGGVAGVTPGGSCTGDCNLLVANSASSRSSIAIESNLAPASANQVLGNFMGTDVTGSVGLAGNNDFAMTIANATGTIIGDGSAGGRNVIGGNNTGIAVSSTTASIRGNFIGINSAGTARITHPGGFNQINGAVVLAGGSSSVVESNVISGNDGWGVLVSGAGASGNAVRGNIIGLNAAGTAAVGNGSHGVLLFNEAKDNTIGGTTAAARNIISGNAAAGVSLGSDPAITNNRIWGNYIGSNAAGTLGIPNTVAGVLIDIASGNFVGGALTGQGNLIAYNNGPGVIITGAAVNNAIVGNAMFANAGLGIDLGNNGVTGNDTLDADNGANRLQNAPLLTEAATDHISGTLHSSASGAFTIHFYTSDNDPSGFGEGRALLGSVPVTTNATGDAPFMFLTALAGGVPVTATATSATGDTSEFSNNITFASALTITDTGLFQATEGQPYSDVVFALGGQPPYAWFANGLPGGLLMNAATGEISGTPTGAPGTYYVTVGLSDSSVPQQSNARVYQLVVNPAVTGAALVSFVTQPSNAEAGQPINPPVQVLVRDSLGAVLPGVMVRLTGKATVTTIALSSSQSGGIAIDRARNRIWHVNHYDGFSVSVFDGYTMQLIREIPLNIRPTGIAYDPVGDRMYIAGWWNSEIYVVDAATFALITTVPSGTSTPETVAIDPVLRRLYIGSSTAGTTVRDLNSPTLAQVATYATGAYSIAVNTTTHRVYLGLWNSIDVWDGSTDTFVQNVGPLGASGGRTLAVNEVTNRIFATGGFFTESGDGFFAVDGVTNQVLTSFYLKSATGIAVDEMRNRIYTASGSGGGEGYNIFDGGTFAQIDFVGLGLGQGQLAVNPNTGRMYAGTNAGAIAVVTDPVLNGATNAVTDATGVAQFSVLSVDAIANGYRLDATAGSSTTTSNPFSIVGSTIVNSTADTGPGSLRQAMVAAQASPGLDTITFNIPGAGPHTITPSFNLPVMTNAGGPVVIDGTTQPGYAGDPLVEIDGVSLAMGSWGVFVSADGSAVRGLMLNRFPHHALKLASANNVVEANWIGLAPDGVSAKGSPLGIMIDGTSGNIIGGLTPATRNVLSGNGDGILLWLGASGNFVRGNYIGTNKLGTAAVANSSYGIQIQEGKNNTIGGTAAGARNVISGNGAAGIRVEAASSTSNTIVGNYIGLDAAGTAAVPNALAGIDVSSAAPDTVIGGTTAAARNVISGNGGKGVWLRFGATGTLVEGNYIGTNAAGTAAVANADYGIAVDNAHNVQIGLQDGASATRNVISGNGAAGVLIQNASDVALQRNRIGTTADGLGALANGAEGVLVQGTSSGVIVGGTIADDANRIASNGGDGVSINVSEPITSGLVSWWPAGTALDAEGTNHGTLQNGAAAVATGRSLAAGAAFSFDGVDDTLTVPDSPSLSTPHRTVSLWVKVATPHDGTDRVIAEKLAADPGTSPQQGDGWQIWLNGPDGPPGVGAIPTVSAAIAIGGVGELVHGAIPITIGAWHHVAMTYDGVDIKLYVDGTLDATTPFDEIINPDIQNPPLDTSSNLTLGYSDLLPDGYFDGLLDDILYVDRALTPAELQRLALGGTPGGVVVSQNEIFSNGGLGIDLAPDGVTLNDVGDADLGSNRRQNFPVISKPAANIIVALNSKPNTGFTLTVYQSASCNAGAPNDYGEGQEFLSVQGVTTDAAGNVAMVLGSVPPSGTVLTATARGPNGTSEFSKCFVVP